MADSTSQRASFSVDLRLRVGEWVLQRTRHIGRSMLINHIPGNRCSDLDSGQHLLVVVTVLLLGLLLYFLSSLWCGLLSLLLL